MSRTFTLLAFVHRRDGGLCFWCDRVTTLMRRIPAGEPEPPSRATLDHIIPRSKRGAVWDAGNVFLACLRCNSVRSNRDFDDFLTVALSWADGDPVLLPDRHALHDTESRQAQVREAAFVAHPE